MGVWDFFQDQVLGMQWLNDIIGAILSAVGLDLTSQMGGSIQFFIYDLIKISILLIVLIFVISYIQTYFPPERTKRILGKMKGIKGNTAGALLGTVTPFCSCSSIPIFIGFTKAGLPLGTTFAFLISSPLVDLASLVLLMGIFGIEVAVLYVIVGIAIAIVGGWMIEKLHMEDQLADFITQGEIPVAASGCGCKKNIYDNKISYSWEQVKITLRNVFPYLLIGVFIGALIHNWIPAEWIQAVLGENNPFSVIIATLIGAPVYADIFGTIPIAEALFAKGVEVGTILAFMMSVTVLSIPSLVMLKTAVKKKLMFIFVVIVMGGVILTGYLFNWMVPFL